jgi:peroxiredoxin
MKISRQTSPLGTVQPDCPLARGDSVLRRHLGWMAVGGLSLGSWMARAADVQADASTAANAAGAALRHRDLPASLMRVPQTLLAIAHSEEGQRELGVQAETEAGFDEALRKVAAGWMRWRNQPDPEQREAIARAETAVVGEVRRRWGGAAVARLRQLELQGQGARALLRAELVEHLTITAEQRAKFDALFERSDQALGQVRAVGAAGRAQRQAALTRIRQIESEAARRVLSAGQQSRWLECLGAVRDTSAFERVLPMAPELVDSGIWVEGERKARLGDLRGKVVLLHFYAFQCHNCHANFAIYNRWHQTLRDQGIEVVGVQSPETDEERDAGKVVAAAKKAGFQFPVLIDLKSANWDAWGTTMWPTVYVIDRRGYVRHWWMGELRWKGAQGDQEIERLAKRLSA